MVVGITGRKGSGKDAAGDYLIANEDYKLCKIAFPLKQAIMWLFGWVVDDIEDPIKKEQIDPRWGVSPRQVMQYFGHDLLIDMGKKFPDFAEKVGTNLHIMRLEERISELNAERVVVTDVRFPGEVALIHDMGGIVGRINRPGNALNKLSNHASENYIEELQADADIVNDSTLPDLYKKIQDFVKTKE